MGSAAIIGAGQAGLQLGFGLLAGGWDVSVFTDRSANEVFNGRATATAFMFDCALSYERELGLAPWDDKVPWSEGIHLDLATRPRKPLLSVEGRLRAPAQAVDQRLKYSHWLREFERRGGRLSVGPTTVADLETVAEMADLVCVATGRGGLASLFQRDEARSTYSEPQRQLALLNLLGVKQSPEIPFRNPAKLTFMASEGEIFWVPFFDKSQVPCYSLLFEAKPGSRMDRFREVTTGEEMIAVAQEVVTDICPWESETIAQVTLTDPHAWAKGAVTPTVRRPVARLPSGRAAMAIGDSVVINDPIAAQGSNCASKMAHFLAERIIHREGQAYDQHWMEAQFEEFWRRDAEAITRFTNTLLEPLTAATREILIAATRNRAVGDAFFSGFDEPQNLHPELEDLRAARRFLTAKTGRPWPRTTVSAWAGLALARLRHPVGGDPPRPVGPPRCEVRGRPAY